MAFKKIYGVATRSYNCAEWLSLARKEASLNGSLRFQIEITEQQDFAQLRPDVVLEVPLLGGLLVQLLLHFRPFRFGLLDAAFNVLTLVRQFLLVPGKPKK